METAEQKCVRKALTKTYLWSTSLMMAGQTITFWKSMKKSIQLSVPISQVSGYAAYLQTKLNIDVEESTIEAAKQNLKLSWKKLCQIQKEDQAYRRQYLEELDEKRELESGISAASILRQLINNEESKERHRKINYYMKSKRNKSLSSILIPVGTDSKDKFEKKWDEVTGRENIEEVLLSRNRKKFQESSFSPFAR